MKSLIEDGVFEEAVQHKSKITTTTTIKNTKNGILFGHFIPLTERIWENTCNNCPYINNGVFRSVSNI